jgi:ribonuclease R
MESKARVTYGEAQEVLDSGTPPRLKDVAENIRRSADLAKILMQKRFREGSLDLEIPETQVVVDTSGESVDIIKSERLFAHRLIEELMLVSNICAARFLDQAEIPGVYRIHEEPDPDNIKALQRYLWNLGGNKSVMGGLLQKKLTKALQSMEGKPEAQILNILTLRTMKQAHYSADNVGHFGLGFSHYTHFTSPIRRYPDLIAHRLIKSQVYGKYRSMEMTEEELASATTMLSACEQRSVKAERQVISIKKARFIRRFVGQEFDGIISSVTKFGCFVLLRQYDVDGLVKIEDLGPDRFMFDDENLRLIGARSGLRYSIGDAIRVRVRGADPEQGKVDFELAIDFDADRSSDEEFGMDGEVRAEERRRGDRRQSDRRKEGRKDFSGKAPRRAASGRSDRRGDDRKEKGASSAVKRVKTPGRRRQKKSR